MKREGRKGIELKVGCVSYLYNIINAIIVRISLLYFEKNNTMVDFKMWIVFVAGLVPLLVGMIWYNPKVFGNAWMKSTGLTEEQLRNVNMLKVYGLTYVFSVLIAMGLIPIVIHQMGIMSVFANDTTVKDPNSESYRYLADFFGKYGQNFRTFKHGAFHGALTSIFLAMPVLGIMVLFEKKSAKYLFIHAGFYLVCMMLMGGIICQFM
jgi:hypothetical protein